MATKSTASPLRQPVSGERRAAPRRLVSELEGLLGADGCPVCRHLAQAERTFFSWFEIENSTAVEVQHQLRAGLGMCQVHSRHLIEVTGPGPIAIRVMHQALAGAQAAAFGGVRGPCPACQAVAAAEQRGLEMLLDGLLDPVIARLYGDRQGMCLPHVLAAAASASAASLELIAGRLLTSVRDEADPEIALVAGRDDDAARRAGWRRRLPVEDVGGSTLDALGARLRIEACPVCLQRGRMQRTYVDWWVSDLLSGDRSAVRTPGELCPNHLHDLALADAVAGRDGARRTRAGAVVRLSRLLEQVSELAPRPRRPRRSVDVLARARGEFTSVSHCPACHACDATEHSQLDLMRRALALAPMRDRYEHSHGLCVRHVAALGSAGPAEPARRHLAARLGVLAWEVDETARKSAWAARHEPAGTEQGAWLRALVQIDGLVFEGGPAPAEELRRSSGVQGEDVVQECLTSVPVPPPDPGRP